MKAAVAWVKSVVRDYLDAHCALHAAGLTYFSMLALIPILSLILVLAKVAHVDDYARAQINHQIDAMIVNVQNGNADEKKKIAAQEFSIQARKFSDILFQRINEFDISRLGLIGLIVLLWTVISSLGQVEISMNEIWRVEKPRPLWRKAYLYLFVAIVMPVLAALALSLPILNAIKNVVVWAMGSVWLTKWVSDGIVWFLDFRLFRALVALFFASVGFGSFLWVMPNCRVKFRQALLGGAMTAVLFISVLKICSSAQVGIARTSALYGSFAFLPIVLAWFYFSWQVVLVGACFVRAFNKVSLERKITK